MAVTWRSCAPCAHAPACPSGLKPGVHACMQPSPSQRSCPPLCRVPAVVHPGAAGHGARWVRGLRSRVRWAGAACSARCVCCGGVVGAVGMVGGWWCVHTHTLGAAQQNQAPACDGLCGASATGRQERVPRGYIPCCLCRTPTPNHRPLPRAVRSHPPDHDRWPRVWQHFRDSHRLPKRDAGRNSRLPHCTVSRA